MIINTTSCFGCPFMIEDYDDFAIGFDTLLKCGLQTHLNAENKTNKEYIIECFDRKNNEEFINNKTPNWCPLKIEEFTIKLKNDVI